MAKLMLQLGCSPLKQLNPSASSRLLSADRSSAEPQAVRDPELRPTVSANPCDQASPLDDSKMCGMFLFLV
jgi:hypothetical protein